MTRRANQVIHQGKIPEHHEWKRIHDYQPDPRSVGLPLRPLRDRVFLFEDESVIFPRQALQAFGEHIDCEFVVLSGINPQSQDLELLVLHFWDLKVELPKVKDFVGHYSEITGLIVRSTANRLPGSKPGFAECFLKDDERFQGTLKYIEVDTSFPWISIIDFGDEDGPMKLAIITPVVPEKLHLFEMIAVARNDLAFFPDYWNYLIELYEISRDLGTVLPSRPSPELLARGRVLV